MNTFKKITLVVFIVPAVAMTLASAAILAYAALFGLTSGLASWGVTLCAVAVLWFTLGALFFTVGILWGKS